MSTFMSIIILRYKAVAVSPTLAAGQQRTPSHSTRQPEDIHRGTVVITFGSLVGLLGSICVTQLLG